MVGVIKVVRPDFWLLRALKIEVVLGRSEVELRECTAESLDPGALRLSLRGTDLGMAAPWWLIRPSSCLMHLTIVLFTGTFGQSHTNHLVQHSERSHGKIHVQARSPARVERSATSSSPKGVSSFKSEAVRQMRLNVIL